MRDDLRSDYQRRRDAELDACLEDLELSPEVLEEIREHVAELRDTIHRLIRKLYEEQHGRHQAEAKGRLLAANFGKRLREIK